MQATSSAVASGACLVEEALEAKQCGSSHFIEFVTLDWVMQGLRSPDAVSRYSRTF